jgi:hypothetical protein
VRIDFFIIHFVENLLGFKVQEVATRNNQSGLLSKFTHPSGDGGAELLNVLQDSNVCDPILALSTKSPRRYHQGLLVTSYVRPEGTFDF